MGYDSLIKKLESIDISSFSRERPKKSNPRRPYTARLYYIPKYDLYVLRDEGVNPPRLKHRLVGRLTIRPGMEVDGEPYPKLEQAMDWLRGRA